MAKKFVVADLSSIETRVTGWVAECAAILKVFEEGRDPYIDFGTRMYHQSYEDLNPEVTGISKEEKSARKDKRQLCKPAVLGAGYGLGGGEEGYDKNGDEIKTGLWGYSESLGVAMTQEQAHQSVQVYRQSYPEVCTSWRQLESAAVQATQTGVRFATNKCVFDAKPGKLLYVTLPSGRRLHYIRARVEDNKLSYEGNIIGTHWGEIRTYGAKILENIVQAISRDILLLGMLRAKETGFSIVGHSHDEALCLEDANGPLGLKQLIDCLTTGISWAPGLLLAADGYEDEVYHK